MLGIKHLLFGDAREVNFRREKFSAWAEGSDPPERINALWGGISAYLLLSPEWEGISDSVQTSGEKSQGPHARGCEEEGCSGSGGQN